MNDYFKFYFSAIDGKPRVMLGVKIIMLGRDLEAQYFFHACGMYAKSL